MIVVIPGPASLVAFDGATRRTGEFRNKFDIEYTLLAAGSPDNKPAGSVRYVQTGSNGPGTGRHYEKLTAHLPRTAKQLLAE